MREDGDIDYSVYTLAELKDALAHIDSSTYPRNYRNLMDAIDEKAGDAPDVTATDEMQRRIPVGSYGLIEIPIDRRFIWIVRVVMLAIFIPCAVEVYDVVNSGIANTRSGAVSRGEHWAYYAYLFKYVMFALFFLWLGSFGVRERGSDSDRGNA